MSTNPQAVQEGQGPAAGTQPAATKLASSEHETWISGVARTSYRSKSSACRGRRHSWLPSPPPLSRRQLALERVAHSPAMLCTSPDADLMEQRHLTGFALLPDYTPSRPLAGRLQAAWQGWDVAGQSAYMPRDSLQPAALSMKQVHSAEAHLHSVFNLSLSPHPPAAACPLPRLRRRHRRPAAAPHALTAAG